MSQVDVRSVMSGLKGFQRDAVNHVFERFYGEGSAEASGRFLIADETGLGKSIIARGVIARAIEHLETVDDVKRIDVVYVCSNTDLANQNLKRLNVTGDPHIGMTTRLTMLAKESARLSADDGGTGKKVNLVSFTPGTSFSEGGWRQGSAPERAMLTIILDRLLPDQTRSQRRTTRLIFQGAVGSLARFDERYVKPLESELRGEPDPKIVAAFKAIVERDGSLDRFVALRDDAQGRHKLPTDLWQRASNVTAEFRQCLSRAGVDTLEPDLIILDEFQRFRHLMADPESGGAAELAHSLFDYPGAKVLLLSATPYKPFTDGGDDGDDHYRDFLATVKFLAGGGKDAASDVKSALADFRQSLVTGGEAADATAAAARVRETLIPFMTRSERPQLAADDDLLAVRHLDGGVPNPDDLAEWAALQKLAHQVDAPIDIEYWKSIPYFVNFMDGYKPAHMTQAALSEPNGDDVAKALAGVRGLSRSAIEDFDPVDEGNGYLRALSKETVGAGWWKLLWMPASMPYLEPGHHFGPLSDGNMTKRVVFSAWTGVPTAVASLLSYESDRLTAGKRDVLTQNTPDARKSVAARLTYSLGIDGKPAGLSALALFWPHPGLAVAGDPLAAVRQAGRLLPAAELVRIVGESIPPAAAAGQAWEAFFRSPRVLPASLQKVDARTLLETRQDESGDDELSTAAGLVEHIRVALDSTRTLSPASVAHLDTDLATLAAHSPGNIAHRALKSVAGAKVSEEGLWRAAWTLANGIRSLFNRRESIALLVNLYGDDAPYWRRVLEYCADGNLQAVLDEYVFQLHSELGGAELDDERMRDLASSAVGALGLRPARYVAHDTTRERAEIPFNARFAVRYGGRFDTDAPEAVGNRQADVRNAFNSPFAPFVLASTSVGQEGIDFHWWSHSVTHWNLPSNPVDFEQREGRVNRFAGHAVRKNVAAAHWEQVLSSRDSSPWSAAFAAAGDVEDGLGEFSPWWVYRGPAKIERVVASYRLSRDIDKYERLRDALALYRLTLGQPRQEDMVELLRVRGQSALAMPTIDLRPPTY